MKTALIPVLASVLLGLTACSTTRQERSKQTAASMQAVTQMLARGEKQAAALQTATTALAQAQPADLRKAYERFAKEGATLRALAADARSQADAMRKRSKAYFANWEKEMGQISNSDLKKMSQERQAQLQSEYGDIAAAMTGLSAAYTACETSMTDIEKFMGNDLTAAGSQIAKPHLDRLATEVGAVQKASRKAQDALAHLHAVLKPN